MIDDVVARRLERAGLLRQAQNRKAEMPSFLSRRVKPSKKGVDILETLLRNREEERGIFSNME